MTPAHLQYQTPVNRKHPLHMMQFAREHARFLSAHEIVPEAETFMPAESALQHWISLWATFHVGTNHPAGHEDMQKPRLE
mmetsp:Transcript_16747/g.37073  ORF Transcript_16747/g.37073 Transcript_16747/m.37073 type:complete len:80 (-) Transcript_16747:12-251(-)